MTNQMFTSQTQNVACFQNNGGLNTTASILAVAENEATDLQNVDLDLWGAIRKRGGYLHLNPSETSYNSDAIGAGVHYYETSSGTDYLLSVFGDKLYRMSDFDGSQTDITGNLTLTEGQNNQVQWKTYRNTAIGTNNVDVPFKYNATGGMVTTATLGAGGTNYSVGDLIFLTGAGDGTAVVKVATLGGSDAVATFTVVGAGSGYSVANGITTSAPESGTLGSGCTINVTAVTTTAVPMLLPTEMTKVKSFEIFFGHTIAANVTVNGVKYGSRIHWSYPGTIERWWDADWADVDRDDGTDVVCVKSLGERLVIFKERSIWIAAYTGDTDVPYVLSKTPSNVGCIARDSVQEVNNGLIFLSYDGLWYFDGSNSTKISDKLNYTFKNEVSATRMNYAVSTMYRSRNQYMITLTESSGTQNTCTYVWDYYTKGFTRHRGFEANSITTCNVANEERIYFTDSNGFLYRYDIGVDDYPLGVQTAINAFYKTKWFSFGDLVCVKSSPQLVTYTDFNNGSLTLGYAYDFDDIDQYTVVIPMSTGTATYDAPTSIYDVSKYAGSGGFPRRTDMAGRGRVLRLSFSNNALSETFKLSGFGMSVMLETVTS